jgi:hypothetical protein
MIGGVILMGLLGVAGTLGVAQQREPRIPLETRNFMRAKLEQSQKILEGLTTENFDLVVKHGQEMSLLSLESQWNVLRTREYVDQSAEFRNAINRMIEAANAKKLDAATLGYLDVTLKCVHCHKYVRGKGAKEAIGLQAPVPESLTSRTLGR